MSTATDTAILHLNALGFTEVESAVYVSLLRESPATGYRVAQTSGRTAANVYKALETLEQKGAVMVEDTEPRSYRAIPPEELLRSLESAFAKRRARAASTLGRIRASPADERTYRLATRSQVFERCRTILGEARHVVLLDVFPHPLAELADDIVGAARRGVRVAALVYEPTVLDGVEVVLHFDAERVTRQWSAQWLNISADAAVHAHALVSADEDEVPHATWSASPFLAHLYQSGLIGEMAHSVARRLTKSGESAERIAAGLDRIETFMHRDTPAFTMLASPSRSRPRGRER